MSLNERERTILKDALIALTYINRSTQIQWDLNLLDRVQNDIEAVLNANKEG